MNRRRKVAFAAAIPLVFLLNGALAQENTLKDQLVGTWALATADAFGANPKGSLIFDASGHFSAILERAGLPKVAANNRLQGTPEENKAIVDGTLTFFGTYSVAGSDLNLRIEGSSYPNWERTNQKRTNVSVHGGELTYTQPLPSGGGPATIVVWTRAK
jgi:hypothetical protein